MEDFQKSVSILFVLLNPFSMTLYLIELIREIEGRVFRLVLIRASIISGSI